MQDITPPPLPDLRRSFSALRCALLFPLLFALPPQQFPVNLGDFFEVIFDLVVVLDPAPDLVYLFTRNDAAGGSSPSQRDREIPHWPMPLTSGALAGRIPAGDVSLDQRAAQGFSDRRKLLRQTLPAMAQSQFRKPLELATCLHLSASIPKNGLPFASANFQTCEFPPTSRVRKEIELACETPAAC